MDQDLQSGTLRDPAPEVDEQATSRFFPEGPRELADELDSYLRWLGEKASTIPGLRGFFLSGGYGRGEGGIFQESQSDAPALYNDLEFYVFAPAVSPDAVEKWVHEGEARFGIETEFKVLPPGALENAVPSMFFYDLLQAHEFVAGDQAWVHALPKKLTDARQIPLLEGSRLLINRGMSLLRCARWADGERDLPADFCARITAKAKLALADAALVASKQYHWSCRRRHELLPEVSSVPPNWQRLIEWHAEAVEFKLHPSIPKLSPAEWKAPLRELISAWCQVFLWLESARCGKKFRNSMDYAATRGRLFPEESAVRNFLRQARDLRHSPHVPLQWGDHPRAAIWRCAALLLEAASTDDPSAQTKLVQSAAELLGISTTTPAPDVEENLRACWTRYP